MEKKFKVGDKVRVKDLSEIDNDKHPGINEYMYHYSGKEAVITKVDSDLYGISIDKDEWSWSYEMLEYINDYITTKDFIKEVEKLGYEVDENIQELLIIEDYACVYVRIERRFEVYGASDNLLELILKYANTPIEFREVKEYEFELPVKFQGKFTQEEIDVLKKDEIFNRLNIKEV